MIGKGKYQSHNSIVSEEQAEIICHSDVSYDYYKEVGYYGLLIETSRSQYADVGIFKDCFDESNAYEIAAAFVLVRKLDSRFDGKSILVNLDNESVVQSINDLANMKSKERKELVRKVQETSKKSSNDFHFNHVNRESNRIADSLAREARKSDNPKAFSRFLKMKSKKNYNVSRKKNDKEVYVIKNLCGDKIQTVNLTDTSCYCSAFLSQENCSRKCKHIFYVEDKIGKTHSHKIPQKQIESLEKQTWKIS